MKLMRQKKEFRPFSIGIENCEEAGRLCHILTVARGTPLLNLNDDVLADTFIQYLRQGLE